MASTHIQAPVLMAVTLVLMVTQLACDVVDMVACSDCLAACATSAHHMVLRRSLLCCAVLCCSLLCNIETRL